MKAVKQGAVLFVIMSLALIFTACDNVMIGSVESKTESFYSVQYKEFNGTREVSFTVKEDETPITVDVGTSSGKLDITLREKGDDQKTALYIDEKNVGTTTIEGYLPKGEYIFEATAEKHVGGFSIDH